ncbi:MAG: DUF4230 domain-containing protein [Defluviitaleaceae bacterium]|nr:DUF4230 domain-containing protein [Defluviitaleaceae bacterium]
MENQERDSIRNEEAKKGAIDITIQGLTSLKKNYSTIITLVAILAIVSLSFFVYIVNRKPVHTQTRGNVSYHEAILREMSEAMRLVTLDIGMEHPVTVSNDAKWGAFRASQQIDFYINGTFSVDLALLTTENVIIDDRRECVFVFLPRPQIENVSVDHDRTTFNDPDKGLLRFRDHSLTPMENNTIQTDVVDNVRMLMLDNYMEAAETATLSQVTQLLSVVLGGVGLGDYDFELVWK